MHIESVKLQIGRALVCLSQRDLVVRYETVTAGRPAVVTLGLDWLGGAVLGVRVALVVDDVSCQALCTRWRLNLQLQMSLLAWYGRDDHVDLRMSKRKWNRRMEMVQGTHLL